MAEAEEDKQMEENSKSGGGKCTAEQTKAIEATDKT